MSVGFIIISATNTHEQAKYYTKWNVGSVVEPYPEPVILISIANTTCIIIIYLTFSSPLSYVEELRHDSGRSIRGFVS